VCVFVCECVCECVCESKVRKYLRVSMCVCECVYVHVCYNIRVYMCVCDTGQVTYKDDICPLKKLNTTQEFILGQSKPIYGNGHV